MESGSAFIITNPSSTKCRSPRLPGTVRMLKMIYCLRRVKSLSLEEFQGHWLEFHSQFGKRLKSLRRYVQYHALANDPIREAMAQAGASHVETYDGLAIGWFDSREAMQAEMDNATVAAA